MDAEEQIIEKLEKRKRTFLTPRNVFLGMLVLFIIISLTGRKYGMNMYKKLIDAEVEKLEQKKIELNELDAFYENRLNEKDQEINNLQVERNIIYNESQHFKNLSEELQNQINTINNRIYTIEYLDSLSKFIKYR